MLIQLIDFVMAIGAVIAAVAVGGVCFVGLLVWMGGKTPKPAK